MGDETDAAIYNDGNLARGNLKPFVNQIMQGIMEKKFNSHSNKVNIEQFESTEPMDISYIYECNPYLLSTANPSITIKDLRLARKFRNHSKSKFLDSITEIPSELAKMESLRTLDSISNSFRPHYQPLRRPHTMTMQKRVMLQKSGKSEMDRAEQESEIVPAIGKLVDILRPESQKNFLNMVIK